MWQNRIEKVCLLSRWARPAARRPQLFQLFFGQPQHVFARRWESFERDQNRLRGLTIIFRKHTNISMPSEMIASPSSQIPPFEARTFWTEPRLLQTWPAGVPHFSTREVEGNPESSLGRLASLASLAPTRGSPRVPLGFKTVFRLRVRIWRGSLHHLNQTKISFIDRKTF
jgi:hypothetical protein